MTKKQLTQPTTTQDIVESIIIEDSEKEAVRGGYKIRTQIMSDDVLDNKFMDRFCKKYTEEIDKYNQKFPTSPKTEQIKRWRARIESMHKKIKQIESDDSMSSADKITIINRCIKRIEFDEFSIRNALSYLQARANEGRELFEKMSKTK